MIWRWKCVISLSNCLVWYVGSTIFREDIHTWSCYFSKETQLKTSSWLRYVSDTLTGRPLFSLAFVFTLSCSSLASCSSLCNSRISGTDTSSSSDWASFSSSFYNKKINAQHTFSWSLLQLLFDLVKQHTLFLSLGGGECALGDKVK